MFNIRIARKQFYLIHFNTVFSLYSVELSYSNFVFSNVFPILLLWLLFPKGIWKWDSAFKKMLRCNRFLIMKSMKRVFIIKNPEYYITSTWKRATVCWVLSFAFLVHVTTYFSWAYSVHIWKSPFRRASWHVLHQVYVKCARIHRRPSKTRGLCGQCSVTALWPISWFSLEATAEISFEIEINATFLSLIWKSWLTPDMEGGIYI